MNPLTEIIIGGREPGSGKTANFADLRPGTIRVPLLWEHVRVGDFRAFDFRHPVGRALVDARWSAAGTHIEDGQTTMTDLLVSGWVTLRHGATLADFIRIGRSNGDLLRRLVMPRFSQTWSRGIAIDLVARTMDFSGREGLTQSSQSPQSPEVEDERPCGVCGKPVDRCSCFVGPT